MDLINKIITQEERELYEIRFEKQDWKTEALKDVERMCRDKEEHIIIITPNRAL